MVGQKTTVCKLLPAFKEQRGKDRIQIDGIIRENAGAAIGESVVIRRISAQPAAEVVLDPLGYTPSQPRSGVHRQPVGRAAGGRRGPRPGHAVRQPLRRFSGQERQSQGSRGDRRRHAAEDRRQPQGRGGRPGHRRRPMSYEDIGGLRRQLDRVREIVELPLRYPELFERLGIEAPKGVLLLGPPGCGKTLIARAVAHETEANFFAVNGPEIIHKFYGESEAHLRKILDEATRKAPSIIFLDEIDAIAPHRDRAVGDVEKRVVAQLLGLMDGLSQRQHVVVLAATNLPNMLDPALRRPGRFDREISIPIPDQHGREEILEIHSRGMPLADDVQVARLAAITHGFVGADLEALCREAGMNALRRLLPQVDFSQRHIPYELLAQLEVNMENFQEALREVEPSAIREVFVEVPDVGWDDVGGLEDVKQRLREAVEWPMKYADLFRSFHLSPPKGLLLSGPPGCGKTLIAKALAAETEVNFIAVKGPELMSMYVGESERGVREVFHKARQAAPCIVFFDEIDAMASTRAGGGHQDAGVGGRVLSQLLTELDGIEELKGVLVLAATNRRDLLDPALLRPGRFDLQIELPLPDHAAREKIFQVHMRDRPIAADITAALAGRTDPGLQRRGDRGRLPPGDDGRAGPADRGLARAARRHGPGNRPRARRGSDSRSRPADGDEWNMSDLHYCQYAFAGADCRVDGDRRGRRSPLRGRADRRRADRRGGQPHRTGPSSIRPGCKGRRPRTSVGSARLRPGTTRSSAGRRKAPRCCRCGWARSSARRIPCWRRICALPRQGRRIPATASAIGGSGASNSTLAKVRIDEIRPTAGPPSPHYLSPAANGNRLPDAKEGPTRHAAGTADGHAADGPDRGRVLDGQGRAVLPHPHAAERPDRPQRRNGVQRGVSPAPLGARRAGWRRSTACGRTCTARGCCWN